MGVVSMAARTDIVHVLPFSVVTLRCTSLSKRANVPKRVSLPVFSRCQPSISWKLTQFWKLPRGNRKGLCTCLSGSSSWNAYVVRCQDIIQTQSSGKIWPGPFSGSCRVQATSFTKQYLIYWKETGSDGTLRRLGCVKSLVSPLFFLLILVLTA